MKKIFLILWALVFVATCISCKSTETNVKKEQTAPKKVEQSENTEAINVAKQWLLLVDAGSYGESWEKAAPFFKKAMSKEKWIETLNGYLPSYGKVKMREVISSKYYTELPGAPDGEYVVIQFKTSYENKQNTIETVTPMKDDGNWKVSGYFIK